MAGSPGIARGRVRVIRSLAEGEALARITERLVRMSADLDTTTRDTVSSLNSLAATLAKVNSGLGRAAPGTSGNAALLDQRDQTLEAMSALTYLTA